MGGTVGKIQNAVDSIKKDIGATIFAVLDAIKSFRQDATGTMANVSNECLETLRIIRHQVNHSMFLLTNAVLAMITGIVLGILLHLTHFSGLLRLIVWIMYACLCLHMVMTYIRHARSSPSETSYQERQSQAIVHYQNQQMEEILAQLKDPTSIDLSGYKLNDQVLEIVINKTIKTNQCTKLQLMGNNITSLGASILAEALINNHSLERLSLWKNQLGDQGVYFLCNILSLNRSNIKRLDLSENGVTDAGAEQLAQMLKTNRKLTHLSTSNNKITDKGIQYLAGALENRNKTLEVLSLTENKLVGDASVDFLISMFKHNHSLKKLFLNDCNLSSKGKDKLRKAVQAKKDFQVYL